jgi:hypothetical protein
VAALEPDALFGCLDRHGVRYVLIGGLAAVLYGSPLVTADADICPSRHPDNLRRLASALAELDARIRTPDAAGGVPFPHVAEFLANVSLLNLVTRAGELDIAFEPAGTAGYDSLAPDASSITVRGVAVPVASLDAVIRSKEAANRPKDLRALPVLRQLRDEIRRRTKA